MLVQFKTLLAFLAAVWGRLADRMTGIGLCLSTQWVSLYLQVEGPELVRFQNPLDLQVEQTNKPNNRTIIIPQGVDWHNCTAMASILQIPEHSGEGARRAGPLAGMFATGQLPKHSKDGARRAGLLAAMLHSC
jgi:hypothetical protein